MTKKDLRHLSRKELVDIGYEMTEEDGTPSELSHEEVTQERDRISYRQRYRKVLASTIGILLVVAAVAVLISTLFLPVIQVSGDSMEPAIFWCCTKPSSIPMVSCAVWHGRTNCY